MVKKVEKEVTKPATATTVTISKAKLAFGIAMLFILLVAFVSIPEPDRLVLMDRISHFGTELNMIMISYCDVSNDKQREIFIRVIQTEIPVWPSDGICGVWERYK